VDLEAHGLSSALELEGDVPGIDEAKPQEAAAGAR
jgi:hypothetical protein